MERNIRDSKKKKIQKIPTRDIRHHVRQHLLQKQMKSGNAAEKQDGDDVFFRESVNEERSL